MWSFSSTDRLYKVTTKFKSTWWLIILPDYTNIIMSFEMKLNSKHRTEELQAKQQGYRNTKTKSQKDENLLLPKE